VASEGLFDGIFGDEKPELEVTMATKAILISATALKIGLFIMCNRLRKVSGTAMALAEDHRNDVLSNVTAITTAVIAFHCPNVWWMDPAGALVISAYIIWCWVNVGKEQVRDPWGSTCPFVPCGINPYYILYKRENVKPISNLFINTCYVTLRGRL
jgi:divalent metal cation (Fe/Co/Zn/Cd) transporter